MTTDAATTDAATTVIEQRSISATGAQRLIALAAERATAIGVPMSIAVVDQAGLLKAFLRMDGCPVLPLEIAVNKAYSGAAFQMPTDAWHGVIKDDEPLRLGIVHTPRLTTFGGGFPIMVDGVCVGGIGVSGGHYSQDMECARHALAGLTTP